MAQTIQIRRGTGSAVPSSLAAGELAINTETGKFYYGNGSTVSSDFRVDSITAESYTVSSSVTSYTFQALSGSTDFGDDIGDIHNRTGSVNVSGSMSIATDLSVAGNLSVALGDGASNHIKLGNSTLGTTGGFLISGSSLGNPLFHICHIAFIIFPTVKWGKERQYKVQQYPNQKLDQLVQLHLRLKLYYLHYSA